MELFRLPKFTDYYNLAYNKRGKLQLTVTQQLGRTSTLYLSGSHQTYWGTSNVDEQFRAGLNTAFEDINWTLSYSLTKTPGKKGRDQMLALTSIYLSAIGRVLTVNLSGDMPVPATACHTISTVG